MAHLDTYCRKRRKTAFLITDNIPFFRDINAFARDYGLLERVSTRSLGTMVAEIARRRICCHSILCLHAMLRHVYSE